MPPDSPSPSGRRPARSRVELLGCPLDPLTLEGTVAAVEEAISSGARIQHASVNAAKVVRARSDPVLRSALWHCDLVTPDGQPVVWAARLLGRPVPERVAGIDLMDALLAAAARAGYRVYLLGARPEVLAAAEAEIARRHPGVVVAGRRDGYFPREEEAAVAADVAAARPDLLFVALDTPRKELFLRRHRDVVRVPFAMGVGGAFDVLAGRRRRAPGWAQAAGLEWLFRLLQEPRRLLGRYAVGNTVFVGLVVRELLAARRAR